MREPTREELLAQIAALQQQLTAQTTVQTGGDRSVVVSGDLRDNVILTGDRNTYLGSVATLTIQSAIFQTPPASGQVDPQELLWTYLNQVINDTGALDLSGVDRRTISDQQEARLELAAVYTALDTVRTVEREPTPKRRNAVADLLEGAERERQSALAFAAAEPYAALLGDPGSGKSTFVNFLALCLAGELLGLATANLTRLGEEWTGGPLLPVRVVLRNFAAQVATAETDEDLLWRYLTRQLAATLPGFAPLLNRQSTALLNAGMRTWPRCAPV